MIELYSIEYSIDGDDYCANIPAKSWKHAEKIAKSFNAKVTGSNIHQVPCIPVNQLMDFCSNICDEPIRWKYNASEQLEAFLSIGWPAIN